jgi:hypothetical protein
MASPWFLRALRTGESRVYRPLVHVPVAVTQSCERLRLRCSRSKHRLASQSNGGSLRASVRQGGLARRGYVQR